MGSDASPREPDAGLSSGALRAPELKTACRTPELRRKCFFMFVTICLCFGSQFSIVFSWIFGAFEGLNFLIQRLFLSCVWGVLQDLSSPVLSVLGSQLRAFQRDASGSLLRP